MSSDTAIEERGPGRIRWLRFVLVLGVGLIGAGVLMFGMATGSLAASVTLSGGSFQVSADRLEGEGFVQFGQVDQTSDGARTVGVNGFRRATLDNFCQSFHVEDLPAVGSMSVKLAAEGKGGLEARNMVADLSELSGDLTFVEPDIGLDASTLDVPEGVRPGAEGTFGMTSKGIVLTDLKQKTWRVTAATLKFDEVSFTAEPGGGNQCY